MTEKTIADELAAMNATRQKVYASVIKQTLEDNERFLALRDVLKKINRYVSETNSLLDPDKYQVKLDAIMARKDELEQKKAAAEEGHANLTEQHDAITTAMETLTESLVDILSGGNVPENFDASINELLDDINIDKLIKEPTDPLAAYRRKKSED